MSRYAYNLQPKGRQKSFYGKAIVVVTNDKYENTHRLYSYDTQVACLDLSRTRHLKSLVGTQLPQQSTFAHSCWKPLEKISQKCVKPFGQPEISGSAKASRHSAMNLPKSM